MKDQICADVEYIATYFNLAVSCNEKDGYVSIWYKDSADYSFMYTEESVPLLVYLYIGLKVEGRVEQHMMTITPLRGVL